MRTVHTIEPQLCFALGGEGNLRPCMGAGSCARLTGLRGFLLRPCLATL